MMMMVNFVIVFDDDDGDDYNRDWAEHSSKTQKQNKYTFQ